LSSASSAALEAALSGASQSCTADSDCTITYLDTDCFHACGAAVSATAQQSLDLASAEQNRTTCAEFAARGCVAQVPPCVAPGLAACIGKECTEFQGSAPTNADAGTAKAPLVLNVASGMSVELVVDQRLEVTLGTIGNAAYGEPQLSSTALRFAQRFLPRLQNPGGPTTVFVFQAVSTGKVELTIPHTTREPFKLTVTIR
jgi:hypothetical protein